MENQHFVKTQAIQQQEKSFNITVSVTESGKEYQVCYRNRDFMFGNLEDAWRFVDLIQRNQGPSFGMAKQRQVLQKGLQSKDASATPSIISLLGRIIQLA